MDQCHQCRLDRPALFELNIRQTAWHLSTSRTKTSRTKTSFTSTVVARPLMEVSALRRSSASLSRTSRSAHLWPLTTTAMARVHLFLHGSTQTQGSRLILPHHALWTRRTAKHTQPQHLALAVPGGMATICHARLSPQTRSNKSALYHTLILNATSRGSTLRSQLPRRHPDRQA